MNLRIGFRVALLLACAGEITAAQEPSQKFDPAKALLYKPFVQYPSEARQKGLTGFGIIVLELEPTTGTVTRAYMGKSTGHRVLDDAATTSFARARFKPGTPPRVKVPITFTLTGGRGYTSYDVKKKSMDDVLARFLGKGTVLRGPIPDYPRSQPWTFKQGKGVYELHIDKEGKVESVRILKSSGDEIFDRVTEKTLRKWKLRRGPMVLELPLSFRLTPDEYSVDVSR